MGRITPYVCIYILGNNRMFRTTNQTKIGVKIRRIELHNTSTKNNPPLRKKHWGDIYIMPAYSIKTNFGGCFLLGLCTSLKKISVRSFILRFFLKIGYPKFQSLIIMFPIKMAIWGVHSIFGHTHHIELVMLYPYFP